MKTLTLSLKKQWFDMIKAGVKKEEYRKIKDHYFHMLYNYAEMQKFFGIPPQPYYFDRPQVFHTKQFQKSFDRIVFTLGYPKADDTERRLVFKNPRIRIGTGRPELGAEPGKLYFVITWEA
jgi:hypothetical protein